MSFQLSRDRMLIVEDNIMFVSVLPVLREFHQDGGHESWADSLIRERARHMCTSSYFLFQSFHRIRRPQPALVAGRQFDHGRAFGDGFPGPLDKLRFGFLVTYMVWELQVLGSGLVPVDPLDTLACQDPPNSLPEERNQDREGRINYRLSSL